MHTDWQVRAVVMASLLYAAVAVAVAFELDYRAEAHGRVTLSYPVACEALRGEEYVYFDGSGRVGALAPPDGEASCWVSVFSDLKLERDDRFPGWSAALARKTLIYVCDIPGLSRLCG